MSRPRRPQRDATDDWIRRKRSELSAAAPYVDEAAQDREADRLSDDEREWLESLSRNKGRALTPAEANWALGQYRMYKDF